jgi:hypothetical protein
MAHLSGLGRRVDEVFNPGLDLGLGGSVSERRQAFRQSGQIELEG